MKSAVVQNFCQKKLLVSPPPELVLESLKGVGKKYLSLCASQRLALLGLLRQFLSKDLKPGDSGLPRITLLNTALNAELNVEAKWSFS